MRVLGYCDSPKEALIHNIMSKLNIPSAAAVVLGLDSAPDIPVNYH